MNQNHAFDLSFANSEQAESRIPEIIFTIKKKLLEEFIDRLYNLTSHSFRYANKYLEEDVNFSLPILDLLGNQAFGYQSCGYWTAEDEKIHFRLPLRPRPWTYRCSLTINIVTQALSTPLNTGPGDNVEQDFLLTTLSDRNRSTGYGHAVGGWISERILNWLKTQTKNGVSYTNNHDMVAMPTEVISAQLEAAKAIMANDSGIGGWIRKSGAFSLTCFGNACDLSVYPDQQLDEGCEFAELACHNLDSPEQQLILLAGFAKICELSRKNP